MFVDVGKHLGKRLQGRVLGELHLRQLRQMLGSVEPGQVVVLDFGGVRQATGSWINAAIAELLRWASKSDVDLFPILYNVKDDWIEEFRLVAEWNHQFYLLAIEKQAPPRRASLIKKLDPAQAEAFNMALRLGEVTGAELERKKPSVRATAWNNRLRGLFEKRLLRREKRGREQVYFPVVKEVRLNG